MNLVAAILYVSVIVFYVVDALPTSLVPFYNTVQSPSRPNSSRFRSRVYSRHQRRPVIAFKDNSPSAASPEPAAARALQNNILLAPSIENKLIKARIDGDQAAIDRLQSQMLRKDPDDAKLTIIYTGPSRRDMEAALNVAKMMRLNSVIREFEDWLREDDEIAKFMKTAEFNGALFAIEEALNDEQELLAVQLMLHCSPSYSDIELALEMAERRSRFVAVNNFIVWLELNKARKYYTQ